MAMSPAFRHRGGVSELFRARLTGLVVVTTLVGFYLAARGDVNEGRLLWTLLGTALAAAGASALNQWMERELDARMARTRTRPLPSGELSPRAALIAGLACVAAGLAVLAVAVNVLTAALALVVEVVYLLAYTPLKTRTPACTLVGAVCGAIPPMMGWSGATGTLGAGAWVLFALLFIWQIPHFLALAWLYRHDYERAGFRMLPLVDPRGELTSMATLASAFALPPIAAACLLSGLAGPMGALSCLLAGALFVVPCLDMYFRRTAHSARRVFLASLVYLPLALGLLALDHGAAPDGSPDARVAANAAVAAAIAAAPPAP